VTPKVECLSCGTLSSIEDRYCLKCGQALSDQGLPSRWRIVPDPGADPEGPAD
jgi:hypothetical protein